LIAAEVSPAAGVAGRRPSSLRLYGLISLMALGWSLNFIIGKIALREFPALLLSCLRTTLAGLLMLPVYFLRPNRHGRFSARSGLPLVALGILGVVCNQVLFVLGLNRTSVAHASILVCTAPVIVLLIAAAARQERITAMKLAGLATAVAGVTILQTARHHGSGATLAGDALVISSSLAFALFTVLGKRYTREYGTVTLNTYAYATGALLLVPLTLWQGAGFPFAQVSAAAWISLAYMALVPSVICYLIYYWALTHIPATRASAFSYVQPVIATLVAIPVLSEHVTAQVVLGGALTLGGVYITGRN
jgi:drug/metabolite transporter (DMT)-like permease